MRKHLKKALVHLTLGNPAALMIGEGASQEDIDRLTDEMGLNDPLPLQYFIALPLGMLGARKRRTLVEVAVNGVSLAGISLGFMQAALMMHWFGTDSRGRDIFTSVVYGARISLTVGGVVASVSTVLGNIMGLYVSVNKVMDQLLMRICDAMYALGSGKTRVLWRHIAPNILSPVIMQMTINLATAILAEASLSFLGAGVPSSVIRWKVYGQL